MKQAMNAVALCVAAVLSSAPQWAAAGPWEDAQEAFADYDDGRALALLRQGAEAGDPRAMRAWGLANLHATRLFARHLRANADAAAFWLRRVAQACDAPEGSRPPGCEPG